MGRARRVWTDTLNLIETRIEYVENNRTPESKRLIQETQESMRNGREYNLISGKQYRSPGVQGKNLLER